jgi:hypothetical protein
MSAYKPEFMLINWSKGNIAGCGTEDECREQLTKCAKGSVGPNDAYIIAEVKVLSELKRVES